MHTLPAALQNPLQLSEKRSETCMQCTGGADQHGEQAQQYQDALQGPSLLLLSPGQLHPLPTALLPAQPHQLWARPHITLYLLVSPQAADTARPKGCLQAAKLPVPLSARPGTPTTAGKGSDCCCPVLHARGVGKCINKIILLYH